METWKRSESECVGPIALTKGVLPSMERKCRGQIVGINSVQGLEGVPVRAVVPPALKLFLWSLRSEFHALGTTNIYSARTAFSSNALSAKDRAQGCWMKAF